MIKINIDTKKIADISGDAELKESTCGLDIWGSEDEVRHELIALLEAIEARPPLYHIWIDVLSKWAAKSCEEKGL